MGDLAVRQKINILGSLKFLLTQENIRLEISKRYFSYTFYPI